MTDKIKQVEALIDEIYRVLDVEITERNIDTPHRIAKFWCNEVFAPKDTKELDKVMKAFPNPAPIEGTASPVVCEMEFSSFCFTGKTSIMTPTGYKPISKIKTGDDVLTFNDEGNIVTRKVTATSSHKVNDKIKLTFSDGKKLECTLNHPIYNVDCHDFVRADELRRGDRVYAVRNYQGYSNPNRNPIKHINYDFSLGYVLGTMCSDGSITRNAVRLEVNDLAFAKNFVNALYNAFGISADIEVIKKPSGFLKREIRQYRVRVVNGHLVNIIKEFIGDKKCKSFKLPMVILSDLDILYGFYRAYIDGDGTVYQGRPSIVSANEKFIDDTMKIFGTKYKYHHKTGVYHTNIPSFVYECNHRALEQEKFEENFEPVPFEPIKLEQEEIYVTNIEYLHTDMKPYTVYNFEVEDLHTYIANGIYVHNCEHHLLPFFGKCRIEYTPAEKILGLSKFNRIVNFFSEQPQTQENLTVEICRYIKKITGGKNVRVTLYDTTHTCVECRGVRGKSNTTTTYFID